MKSFYKKSFGKNVRYIVAKLKLDLSLVLIFINLLKKIIKKIYYYKIIFLDTLSKNITYFCYNFDYFWNINKLGGDSNEC